VKTNKLVIEIGQPTRKVFEFTANTPKWISNIVKEEASEWPISIGTIYKNVDRTGKWNEYKVTQLVPNSLFEMRQKNASYYVRYSYEKIAPQKTRLTYLEWVTKGAIESPFTIGTLEKLRLLLEAS
jgi:hypothetical protein